MRTITLALLLLTGTIRIASAQSNEALSGSYSGEIAGTPSMLTLERSGESFSGAIDAGGYGYVLEGTANGDSGSGILTDHQAGAQMQFEIVEHAGAVTVTILNADPFTGEVQRMPLEFRRGGGSAGARDGAGDGVGTGNAGDGVGAGNTGDGAAPQSKDANAERDPALVGAWSYSDTYISGEFSATTRLFMQVNPDGSYAYGSGNISAGLDNDLGSVYGQSGGGDVTRGQWRTQDGIVYIMEAGSPQWVPYARYYVEGNSMMFTFSDGKRQVWNRR